MLAQSTRHRSYVFDRALPAGYDVFPAGAASRSGGQPSTGPCPEGQLCGRRRRTELLQSPLHLEPRPGGGCRFAVCGALPVRRGFRESAARILAATRATEAASGCGTACVLCQLTVGCAQPSPARSLQELESGRGTLGHPVGRQDHGGSDRCADRSVRPHGAQPLAGVRAQTRPGSGQLARLPGHHGT